MALNSLKDGLQNSQSIDQKFLWAYIYNIRHEQGKNKI